LKLFEAAKNFIRCKYVRMTGVRNIVNPNGGVKISLSYVTEWKIFTFYNRKMTKRTNAVWNSSLLLRKNFQKLCVEMQALRQDVLKSEGVYL